MANERLDRFTKLLKEIFELDKSDLDFGIYRVMNLRKERIEEFLEQQLPQIVQETLAPFAQDGKEKLRARMAKMEKDAAEMGMTMDQLPETAPVRKEYMQCQKQLAEGADLAALETDVYAALYSFFNRYYEEGDFISKRRYKEGVYAIPYEGEEVKLYWANQDQYYIKTSESFKDYTFAFDGITIHFRLADATTEQDNNKESKENKRVFMLFTEDHETYPGVKTFEYDPKTKEAVIRFVYDIPKDKKKKYYEENYTAILRWLLSLHREELSPLIAPQSVDKSRKTTTLLEKHLKNYVSKNTFDYFIHRDLRGFLTRELDFFIKSETIHLDDLDTDNEKRVETYLAKATAIKRVGKMIIDFLTQIEDFQKKLWLKKKFVVEANWCMTLDKIDETFWPEIIASKAQIDEWIALYAIDEVDGWRNPPTTAFLRQNSNLIVDTRHFPDGFRDALLEEMEDLDQQTNGLLVRGDNVQALSLLEETFRGRVKCIHIDPPYNTDTSGFLYKNNYRHSSWMSMMNDRIDAAIPFLSHEASFICHIDENEYENLWYLFQGKNLINLGTVIWDKKNPMTGGHGIATQHEYMTWFSPDDITISVNPEHAKAMLKKVDELIRANGGKVDDAVRAAYQTWLNANTEIERGDKAYSNISDDGRIYQSVSLRAPEYRADEKFHRPLIHPVTGKACPVPYNGFSRKPETLQVMMDRGDIIFGKDETIQPRYKMYLSADTEKQLNSVIYESKKGTTDLKKMGLSFPYCHAVSFYDTILSKAAKEPNDMIMDFFAGSGTTGHAVIADNRNNDNDKKYIVVDTEEFVSESLFHSINAPDSGIKLLIGSRKFTEGWNSWRVSTMGLINFAKGEGSQAIQLFGRGVRLKGYGGSLKRSRKLDFAVSAPKYIELLETLSVFGVKAQYMEDFKSYLEQEGAPTNEAVYQFRLPVVSRFDQLKGKRLYIIKVKDGADFKKQARRLILDRPDIQVSPVALNSGEMMFVNHLKKYVDTHSDDLKGKSLYLLRNKSRLGMGFFEAGNFYPDYILWIDTEDKQYISFIDPKGLWYVQPDDLKIEFYKTIKELEARLAPTVGEKEVVLNSFIMSSTRASVLRDRWKMERPQREERNVYTLDNPDCVALMMEKIMS